ncbi:potassium channel family protein [Secundilactobacillus collinoides]|uniref:TrkA domain-containing protein n=2 Tax=Secundilactobacillus collinoides TaxID=33960 RepID=A0A0R2BAI7_SECCO|nr:TrkA family potassium uptake protein [Secundilactobacillus collinoides]KRM76074.1 TrkA domain-containing protein [Secundilactobacillus collinoides DSM 20515 = JCM 1123]KZL35825.1 potassium transporter Trk [Secundilactobacillus collinoides]
MVKTTKRENYAVIGLGQFGRSICQSLVEANQEVMAIDIDEDAVNEFTNIVTRAVIADCQDEDALKDLSIGSFDHVFVAIGSNIQASIMATLLSKELGAKDVICKAENDSHARVLEKIGADQIVQPERDMARRIVFHKLQPNIVNYLILNEKVTLAEVKVDNPTFVGKTLAELALRNKYHVNVIAIAREGKVNTSPLASDEIELNDLISVVGNTADVEKFNGDANP